MRPVGRTMWWLKRAARGLGEALDTPGAERRGVGPYRPPRHEV